MLRAEQIAKVALDHYKGLPSRGKPQSHEWTVYAALVAIASADGEGGDGDRNSEHFWVVSSATGTKCTAAKKENEGNALHDSHAEVLVRRGLVRHLWQHVREQLDNIIVKDNQNQRVQNENRLKSSFDRDSPRCLLARDESGTFKLRDGIELHLYVSDSPCGDSSIYDISVRGDNDDEDLDSKKKYKAILRQQPQFTGAKVVVSESQNVTVEACGGDHQLLPSKDVQLSQHRQQVDKLPPSSNEQQCVVAREHVQLLGRLRTKSGRSNLEATRRSTSMSCSDKILKWLVFGLQGRVLQKYIPQPLRLSSIVVSRDPRSAPINGTRMNDRNKKAATIAQMAGLQRAFADRIDLIKAALRAKSREHSSFSMFAEQITIPDLYVVEEIFPQGKSVMEASRKRRREDDHVVSPRKVSACGFSFNWQAVVTASSGAGGSTEVTVGARGCRQGKTPKTPKDLKALASRLSPGQILFSILQCLSKESMLTANDNGNSKRGSDSTRIVTYQQLKDRLAPLDPIRQYLLEQEGPLAGWIVSVDDFPLPT